MLWFNDVMMSVMTRIWLHGGWTTTTTSQVTVRMKHMFVLRDLALVSSLFLTIVHTKRLFPCSQSVVGRVHETGSEKTSRRCSHRDQQMMQSHLSSSRVKSYSCMS